MSDKKNSIFIGSQIPNFVRNDFAQFVKFIEYYYQWLDEEGNATHVLKNLKNYNNLETAIDSFIDQFFKEIGSDIPVNNLLNKKILLQHIVEYYKSKGIEDSYRFLFRILYGKDSADNLNFYYPNRDIIRCSTSSWTQNKTIRIFQLTGNAFDIKNKSIIGLTSGATAEVENVLQYVLNGKQVFELFLSRLTIIGEFLPNEVVAASTGESGKIIPIISKVSVLNSGSNYVIDDVISITDSTGTNGKITIGEIGLDGEIISLNIIEPGIQYSAPSLSVTTVDGADAVFAIEVGAICHYPGYFKDTSSHISSFAQRLQDNYFYQQFSYVIQAPESISLYKKVVEKNVHPAGLMLFGQFITQTEVDAAKSDEDPGFELIKTIISESEELDLGFTDSRITLSIEPTFVYGLGATYSDVQTWLFNYFYPTHFNYIEPYLFTEDYWQGEYVYDNRNNIPTYLGGLSNTQLTDFDIEDQTEINLCPDSIVLSYPFEPENCSLWLNGDYGKKNIPAQCKFNENAVKTNLFIQPNSILDFGSADFTFAASIIPENTSQEAILGLWGNGNTNVSNALWGNGSASVDVGSAAFDVYEHKKAYALGHANQFFVKIADSSDLNPVTDGTYTYTHTTVIIPDTEYFVAFFHDTVNQQIGISVNGVLELFAHTTGINTADDTRFMIGSVDTPTYISATYTKPRIFNGKIKNVSVYNKVLTTDDIAGLSNNYHGKLYSQLSVYNKHSLIAHWNLDETSGSRVDSHVFKLDSHLYDETKTIDYIVNANTSAKNEKINGKVTEWVDLTYWNGPNENSKFVQSAFDKCPYTTRNDNKENLLKHSESFLDFTKTNFTKSLNRTGSPLSEFSNNAKYLETVTNANHYIENSITVFQGQKYNFSVYVKSVSRDVILELTDRFTNARVGFDLTEKDAFSLLGDSIENTLEELPNNWFRISISATAASTGIAKLRIYSCDITSSAGVFGSIADSYAGDIAKGLILFGSQFRRYEADTNYIPTKDYNHIKSLNGHVGLYFQGTDILEMNSALETLNQPDKSIFIVAETFGVSGSKEIIFGNNTNNYHVGVISNNLFSSFLNIGNSTGSSGDYVVNGKYILEYTYDSLGLLKHNINNITDFSASIGTNSDMVTPYIWKLGGKNATTELFTGIIYEVIVLNTTIAKQVDSVRKYLSNKYNITI